MTMNANWGSLKEARIGIGLHYDGSLTDRGALDWFSHKDCRVSYTYLLWDNGNIHPIAPRTARAYHMGVCRPSSPDLQYRDANSALYGLALAARPPDTALPAQVDSLVALCISLFQQHGWSREETWRIVGHSSECWPRNRKIDPVGPDPLRPVLSVEEVRKRVLG
jgi:N-acetyl-anhydromuramyl-L-alanine amidase AmpD